MIDSAPALAALRLYLYCSKGAADPTMTLWSTLVVTQVHIFAAHACTIGFVITKRMSGMVSRFGLSIRTIPSGLTGTERSPGDTSSATEPARQHGRTSTGAFSFDDDTGRMWDDGGSQVGIMRTTEYYVTHGEMKGRIDSVNRNHF